MIAAFRVFAALAGLAFTAGVVAQPGAGSPAWHGDLASSRAVLVDAAKLYELRHKRKVTLKTLNTIAALEAVAAGTVELVSSARPADARTPAEEQLEFVPVAWDSLVLVTHKSNPVSNLSLKQLRDVYFGRIKTWQPLGGAVKPINLYAVAAPLDGVEWQLRKTLFGNGAALIAAQRWYINTKQLEDAVAIDPLALGVSTLANVIGHKGLKVLTIEGVTPSLKTLEDGQYLLAMPHYIAARRESPGQTSSLQNARVALEFIRDEPALRAAWRKKQLVPFTEAKKLASIVASREQFIIAELGIRPPRPPGPPMPPAPKKGKLLNRPDIVDALVAVKPVKEAPARGATNALALSGTVSQSRCRPQPVCGGAVIAAPPTSP